MLTRHCGWGLPCEGQGLAALYGPDDLPHDAWGTELAYERPGDGFDIVSWGQD